MRRIALLIVAVLGACGGGGGGDGDGGDRPDATGSDGGGGGSDSGGGGDGGSTPGNTHYFPGEAWMNRDWSTAPLAGDSSAIITALRAGGGWGNGDTFQIDFSIDVLTDDGSAPRMTFTQTGDFYDPDCDPAPVPVPAGGNIEGETGYQCASDGDCHLIVWVPTQNRLYEMWRANIVGGVFEGGCLALWDTSMVYPDVGRGDQCTSADAAGFPIAPLLFTADEVFAGEIAHAIRFILPNDRIRTRTYVRPATHGTNTTGAADAPQYGVHFRLRADFPMASLPNDAARTVARALQRYGMFHADGGNIALTAQADRHSAHTWAEAGLEPRDLSALTVEDFEVVDHGPDIALTYDCTRTPITM